MYDVDESNVAAECNTVFQASKIGELIVAIRGKIGETIPPEPWTFSSPNQRFAMNASLGHTYTGVNFLLPV